MSIWIQENIFNLILNDEFGPFRNVISSEPPLIWIIGMMAVGKSTVAKILWSRINNKVVDTDVCIAKLFKAQIQELLLEEWWKDRFRILEHQLILRIARSIRPQKMIISTWGGSPCYYKSIDDMLKSGIVIYLKWTPQTIVDRALLQDKENNRPIRPMFLNLCYAERIQKIQQIAQDREPFYKQAHLTIDTNNKNPEKIVEDILESSK